MIYLDQSYVSTMAKQLAGRVSANHAAQGKLMGDLHSLLARLVAANRVLCPRSSVHDQETDLLRTADAVLSEQIHDVLTELSDGQKFLNYGEIELQQAIRALGRYLEMQTEPEDGRWEHAFYQNPHLPIRLPRVHFRIPWADVLAADDQVRKNRIQKFRASLSATRAARPASFASALEAQFVGVARQRYALPIQKYLQTRIALQSGDGRSLPENVTDQSALDYLNRATPPLAMRLARAYAEFTNTTSPVRDERFWKFLTSPEFRSIPYYDVFCSMEAGFIFYKPGRPPGDSDPYDFAALGSVLPYVDVVTTDASMKDMLLQLGLNTRYRVDVYTARKSDVTALLDRLTALI